MRALLLSAFVGGVAVAAVNAPLWTYALSLALFGLPHVLVELRYVDERFAARLPRATRWWLVVGIAGIALVRASALVGVGGAAERTVVEIGLGVALVGAALPLLVPHGATLLAWAIAAALGFGAVFAPFATLVGFALVHNLTPIGLLAERLRGAERRRALALAALVFGIVPLAILLLPMPDPLLAGPMSSGMLDDHLPVFVPAPLLLTPIADRLFAAAAFLQCMHYAVVLGVLPRLSGGSETAHALVPWPRWRSFAAVVVVAGALVAVDFATDFAAARRLYGVFAAVHAWIEIPVLLAACSLLPRFERRVAVAA